MVATSKSNHIKYEEQSSTSSKPSERICFHCGKSGHGKSKCPSKDEPPSQEGKDAFERFKQHREALRIVKGHTTLEIQMKKCRIIDVKEEELKRERKVLKTYRRHQVIIQEWIIDQWNGIHEKLKKDCNEDENDGDLLIYLFDQKVFQDADIQKNIYHSSREFFEYIMPYVQREIEKRVMKKPMTITSDVEENFRNCPDSQISNASSEGTNMTVFLHCSESFFTGRKRQSNHTLVLETSKTNSSNSSTTKTNNETERKDEKEQNSIAYKFPWHITLNQAVKDGKPPDAFSNEIANRIYTSEKLFTRVRYLFYLIMDENPISNDVRSLLNVHVRDRGDRNPEQKSSIRVCSIGGGPGFDHIAVNLVASFLHSIQPSHGVPSLLPSNIYMEQTIVETQVFELYYKEWEWGGIMSTLRDSFVSVLPERMKAFEDMPKREHSENGSRFDENDEVTSSTESQMTPCSTSDNKNTLSMAGKMTMHSCDIRADLDESLNRDLKTALPHTDIFALSYVLHENSSSIIYHDNDVIEDHDPSYSIDDSVGYIEYQKSSARIKGIFLDILRNAKVGAFILCTDSNNYLWPCIIATAVPLGWVYYSNAEKKDEEQTRIVFGPRSFVILKRTTYTDQSSEV